MIAINTPTLKHIAESSITNTNVEVVIDNILWEYHYLLSEQKLWEIGRIPDLKKPVISLPSDLFFSCINWEMFDVTNQQEIRSKILEILNSKWSLKIAV